ncbi:unnamed protein product [Adineta steineri]|uniref:Uncharacterized protein n=1 Tax=Adineta steineri TaxID=433720 RepID=A0A813WG25_9BILA|nr:unnamed protein product [Adineta steineri]
MKLIILILVILNYGLNCYSRDLYPSYNLLYDPVKALEWSDDPALMYITTIRLFDYEHHIFQYRRYPCQYFYTDEIKLNYNNDTKHECLYNTTTSDYRYSFQLHLDSRHVEPYILRNIAIQCKYINCSLSLLNIKYIRINWNLQGRTNNLNCSFDTTQQYGIYDTPYKLTEWISIRCQSLFACNRSKYNLEQVLLSNIHLIYGSSYELETPYCSLEKNLAHIIETNMAQTNRLLEQVVNLLQRGFGKPNERDQIHMREYVEQKWIQHENSSTTTANKTSISGEVHGAFKQVI